MQTHSSCAKCWQVRRSSLQDHSQSKHSDHEHEALSTTPKVKTLRQRDVTRSSHSARNNINDSEQRVQAELARRVSRHGGIDRSSEAAGKSVDPDAIVETVRTRSMHEDYIQIHSPAQCRVQSRLGPCQSRCLSLLYTKLGILVKTFVENSARRTVRRRHDRSSLVIEGNRLHDHLRLGVIRRSDIISVLTAKRRPLHAERHVDKASK